LPASVIINKKDDTGAALDGAEFTLYEDKGTVGTFEPGTDTAVSPTKKCTTSSGTCTISGILPAGNYCVDETVVPAGYNKAAAQCFSLALNQNRTLADFINPRETGAIEITKTRKHAAATDPANDPHSGVEFTITGGNLDVAGTKVTTNGQGIACLEGLPLSSLAGVGDYTATETVPENYVADGDVAKTVTVSQSGTCSDGNAATVSFSNTPLTDISVSATSLVSGGTKSSISCKLGDTVVGSVGFTENPSLTLSNKVPETYVCTIVVDP
ncbi:MAG TPA: prealbumin-like fold domain-containing protein, partial [Xanthomonadales bacterium]|nr:prealbumin-like fold domain-containing protein [Xanthomonadales bacterium]